MSESIYDVVTLDGIIVRYRRQMTIEETDYLIDVREELRKLRDASITTLVKCAKCENGVRPKFAVCGLCNDCARSEISWLRHCIKSWKREEEDWKVEEERLSNIEMAVRECPTATTRLGGVKALVYTTQLRDALEARPRVA